MKKRLLSLVFVHALAGCKEDPIPPIIDGPGETTFTLQDAAQNVDTATLTSTIFGEAEVAADLDGDGAADDLSLALFVLTSDDPNLCDVITQDQGAFLTSINITQDPVTFGDRAALLLGLFQDKLNTQAGLVAGDSLVNDVETDTAAVFFSSDGAQFIAQGQTDFFNEQLDLTRIDTRLSGTFTSPLAFSLPVQLSTQLTINYNIVERCPALDDFALSKL